jgi:hypothetical protein
MKNKKRTNKKDLLVSVPHAMHARNLFCSSFDFRKTSIIYGNFSQDVKNQIKKKTSSEVKNFNIIHFFHAKIISFYTLLLDKDRNIDGNNFLKLVKKNYNNCDLSFKKVFRHHQNTQLNSIFFFITKIFFLKKFLNLFIFITSIFIYLPTIIKYRPKKILFMCSNSFIDKGLFFLSDIFKIKKYGLISSWDHLSTKRFIDIHKFNKIFIWNNYFRRELKNIYKFDLKKAYSIGLPYYDSLRKKYKKKNFITFFMPSPSMMDETSQYEVIDFLIDYCKNNNLSLYVKPHPGINYADLKKFKKIKKIKFITPKEISMNLYKKIKNKNFIDYELEKIIQESKVVINFHSTTSLDSIYYLTPVINLSLNRKYGWLYKMPYYKYVLDYNAIPIAKSYNDIKKYLNKYIRNPNYNKKNIKKLKKNYFGNKNPNSGKNMSKIIYKD